MDRLEAMAVLVAAVEAGSLSAAGRRLSVPLPTVSRRVAELEAHLGVRLLTRTTRKLTPTEAGAAYVEACRRVLEQVGEAERAATGAHSEPRGELTVTAPLVFGRLHVLPVVSAFLERHPRITVRLSLSDRPVDLIEDHVDAAVRIAHLPDSALVATRLGAITRVVCASPAFLSAHGTPQTPSDLVGLPCVDFADRAGEAEWLFATADGGAVQAVGVGCRLRVNTAEAALDAAMAGVGLTHVLSYQAARAVAEGKLALVLRAFERAPVPVSLMHAGQGRLPQKLRAFLAFAAPRLREAFVPID